jgi:hypothetical protein
MGWGGEQTSEKKRRKERKNRRLAESTLQHDEESTGDDAIAGDTVRTMARVDHDDVIVVGVAA